MGGEAEGARGYATSAFVWFRERGREAGGLAVPGSGRMVC